MTPIEVHIGEVSQLVCGGLYTIVTLKDGSVWGWGCNRQKQLGSGYGSSINKPVLIMNEKQLVKRISCGYSHTLFLSSIPISRRHLLSFDDKNRSIFEERVEKTEFSKDFTAADRV